MSPLLAFVVAAMARLSGDAAPPPDLAQAIASEIETGGGFLPSDKDGSKTAAFMADWAWRESRFVATTRGDSGRSFCAFQIMVGGGKTPEGYTGKELEGDAGKCAQVAFRMMRESFRACAALPAAERGAVYASGHCSSVAGRRISRQRSGEAFKLWASVSTELLAKELP